MRLTHQEVQVFKEGWFTSLRQEICITFLCKITRMILKFYCIVIIIDFNLYYGDRLCYELTNSITKLKGSIVFIFLNTFI